MSSSWRCYVTTVLRFQPALLTYSWPIFSVSGSVTEAVVPSLLRTRYRREARTPDDEEEMWFNDDDELDDDAPLEAAQPHPHSHPHAHHALDAIGSYHKYSL